MKALRMICLIVILLLFSVTCLQASDTRITSMGYLANLYVHDNYNIWDFPSTLARYHSLVLIDSEYAYDLWRGGIHLLLNPNFILGIYLENTIWESEYTDTWFTFRNIYYPGMTADQAAHRFTVFGAYRGGQVDFGLYVSSYGSKERYTDANVSDLDWEDNLNGFELAGGLSYKASERSQFDGTVYYSHGNFKHVETGSNPSQTLAPEGYNTFGILARYFYAMSAKAVIVPFAGYGHGGEGYRSLLTDPPNGIVSWVDKGSMYLLGLGLDLIPVERTLITLAAGWQKYTTTYDMTLSSGTPPPASEMSYSTLPFLSLGLEARIVRWLGVRFSFYELLETWLNKDLMFSNDNDLDELRFTGTSYAARFGFWFKLGRFTIDTLVDTDHSADFLHNGPYIISGKEGTLFTKLSIIYDFNETK